MILIPGLILVGLMIWASTRIKRNAAKAFEREEIETEEFSITKPEGFLSVVDPPGGLLISAYSKEFGREAAGRIRQATIELRRELGGDVDAIVKRVKADSTAVASEQIGVVGGHKCANIIVERLEQDVLLESRHKIIAAPDAVYHLVVNFIPEYKADLEAKLDEALISFSLP
ncbi:MAG: hypothetical protein AB7P09_14445 [Pyrinomonadaceae bacterium]